jgi:hypothetical protein
MKSRIITSILFTLTLCLGVLAGSPAQAAGSVTSVSDGVISGRGTVVTGTYTVKCDFVGEFIYVSLELRQPAGGNYVASSYFYDSFECAGDGIPVTRTYTFSTSPRPFRSDAATVTGSINACNCCGYCISEAVNEEISLVRQ